MKKKKALGTKALIRRFMVFSHALQRPNEWKIHLTGNESDCNSSIWKKEEKKTIVFWLTAFAGTNRAINANIMMNHCDLYSVHLRTIPIMFFLWLYNNNNKHFLKMMSEWFVTKMTPNFLKCSETVRFFESSAPCKSVTTQKCFVSFGQINSISWHHPGKKFSPTI